MIDRKLLDTKHLNEDHQKNNKKSLWWRKKKYIIALNMAENQKRKHGSVWATLKKKTIMVFIEAISRCGSAV